MSDTAQPTSSLSRRTARLDREVTVFLIGMRFNALHRADRWGPVFLAMPRMLSHLEQDPAAGMLGHHLWFGRSTVMLSYWESPEHLQAFAADPDGPHLQPWRDFRRLAADGHVGVWHETYVATPGRTECIYVNMPEEFGLGGAVGSEPVGPGTQTAAQRLRGAPTAGR